MVSGRSIVPAPWKGHSSAMTSASVSKSKSVDASQSLNQVKPEAIESEIKDYLGLVAEMTREFTSSLDFSVVEKSALERIANYIGAEAASLFLVTDAGDSLICSACCRELVRCSSSFRTIFGGLFFY